MASSSRASQLLAAALAVVFLAGCASRSNSGRTTGPSNPGGAPVTASGTVDDALHRLIELAAADLAGRLGVERSVITVASARAVEWPDGSLGCPQPGMAYPQVMVDGTLIELSVAGTVYRYHSGGARQPFLCEAAR